jgi:molecular chaperone DnaK
VHAKDLGTGKEQSIKITASSGLNEQEIKQMVKDAELHADEDRKRRESAETRNQLDSLVYQTEKNLSEHGADVDADSKTNIEQALEKAKKSLEGGEGDAMKAALEELTSAQHKLAEAMYAKASQQSSAGAQQGNGSADGGAGGDAGKRNDDVVDADFDEVKE